MCGNNVYDFMARWRTADNPDVPPLVEATIVVVLTDSSRNTIDGSLGGIVE